jgi:hypothetical protein
VPVAGQGYSARNARRAAGLLAILPPASRAQDWQLAADRACPRADRLRVASDQGGAGLGSWIPATALGGKGQHQADHQDGGKVDQPANLHASIVPAGQESSQNYLRLFFAIMTVWGMPGLA